MEDFKGTKGKWQTRNDYDSAYEQPVISIDCGDSVESLATVWSGSNDNTICEATKADALLISKAPEMLEMLQRISASLEKIWFEDDSNIVFDLIDAEEIDNLIKVSTEIL